MNASITLSVCTSSVFFGVPLVEALPRVRAAGASVYEFWSWWDQDLEAAAAVGRDLGLTPAAMCTRFFTLNDPDRLDEYRRGLRESLDAAAILGCRRLITQVGQDRPGVSRQAQHDAIAAGLRACAPMLEDRGVTLLVEPLNARVDHPGYYLTGSDEGFELIREVQSPNVKLLFDIYHQQITEGDLLRRLTANLSDVGHLHIAGNPGRHEPCEGSEVDYPTLLCALADAGYTGCAGLEYFPRGDADASLRRTLEALGGSSGQGVG